MTAQAKDASHGVPPGVIVAGMHRSATSLTTSVLVGCGWSTSSKPMLASRASQPRGYFEDKAIHNLHKRLLESYKAQWDSALVLERLRPQRLSLNARGEAVDRLISELRDGDPWVWKNPRATLFLDAWADRLPEADVVICVRSPGAVVDSMLRRNNQFHVPRKARFRWLRRVQRGLSLWRSYNFAGERFAAAHPERAVIVRIPQDLRTLAAATIPSLFEPELLADRPKLGVRLIALLDLRSQLLYRRMSRRHDDAHLARILSGPGSDR